MGVDKHEDDLDDEITKCQSIGLSSISILVLMVSVGCVITSALLKSENSDIPDDMFILWAAIPAAVVGLIGIIASMIKKKYFIVVFLVLALFTMVLCGVASVINGLEHWRGGWSYIGSKAKDCTVVKPGTGCGCLYDDTKKVYTAPDPFKDTKCEDLEKIDELLLAQVAMAALTTIVLIASAFLATSILCCGPWAFVPKRRRSSRHTPNAPPQYSTYPAYDMN